MPKKIIFESIKYLIYRILFENKKSLKEPLKSITKNIKISYYEGHTRVTYEKKSIIIEKNDVNLYVYGKRIKQNEIDKINYQKVINLLARLDIL